ncbi:MAG: hypothetical protein GW939_02320 [Candidatus Magasanikbacteria bacterium]|nr:hypothetical protein [Candidatus Magasanikbacteria bacterium]
MTMSFAKKIILVTTFLSVVFLPTAASAAGGTNSEGAPVGWQCRINMKVLGVYASFINANLVNKSIAEQVQIIASQPQNAFCSLEDFQSNTSLVTSLYRYEIGKKIDLFALSNNLFHITQNKAKEKGFLTYFDTGQSDFVQITSWDTGDVVDRCEPLPLTILQGVVVASDGNTEFPILRSGQTTKDSVTEASCPLGTSGGVYQGVYPVGSENYYVVTFTVTNDRQFFANEKVSTDEGLAVPFSLPISLNQCENDLNPFGCISIPQLIGKGISIVVGVMGMFALLWFIYAGVMWMSAAGNVERSGSALKMLVWGGIGILVIFASYAILTFVLGAFT